MQFKMSNKTYDVLCWIARIVLPALGTLYFALASIWNFPYGTEVVGTLTALDTFLGVILGISDAKYDAQKANGELEEGQTESEEPKTDEPAKG